MDSQATIRSEVALVSVVLTATNSRGQLLSGLNVDDFVVYDNKQPQKIEYFGEIGENREVPLTIALLIDTSRSVKDKLEYEKQIVADFFKQILRRKKDLALIMQFDSDVNLVQDFTHDSDALSKALDTLEAGKSTSLYDAVYFTAENKLKYETGRKVMVIVSDGDDNSSLVKREAAIDAAQKNDVLIYGIGVQTPDSSFKALKKFAKETGGAFFSPRAKHGEIQAAFRSIQAYIRGQKT
jgi:Ca-activated chloride channel family protein